jgi:hypothetical protein
MTSGGIPIKIIFVYLSNKTYFNVFLSKISISYEMSIYFLATDY